MGQTEGGGTRRVEFLSEDQARHLVKIYGRWPWRLFQDVAGLQIIVGIGPADAERFS